MGDFFLVIVAGLVGFIGWIMLLVAGGRINLLWSVGMFFVWPVVPTFAAMHWEEARKGFILHMVGMVAIVAIGVTAGVGAAMNAAEQGGMSFQDAPPVDLSEELSEEELAQLNPLERKMLEMAMGQLKQNQAQMEAQMEAHMARMEAMEEGTWEPDGRTDAAYEVEEEAVSLSVPRPARPAAQPAPPPERFGFRPAEVEELPRFIRSRIQVDTAEGRQHTGELLSVTRDRLTLRKRMHGGRFDFEVRRDDIARLKVWDKLSG